MSGKELDQTLVLIKPDALKNSLTGYVLSLLSEFHTGLCFAGTKVVNVTRMLAEEHYTEHRGKAFFPSLLEYIMGLSHYPDEQNKRRVVALVYQGVDAVAKIRAIAGPTNPLVAREQKPGCVRSLGTLFPIKDNSGNIIDQRMDNLIHASATDAEAEREIKLWFKPTDIPPGMHGYSTKKSDRHFYYKEGKLSDVYVPESVCVLAPGDIVWESDLEILNAVTNGSKANGTLESVVAKYLVNQIR
ncbi:MAG: nucleoside-diphosphate kinase [Fibrobacter sp.]|nr:nucleoside-diphosphate kinase [Fibrobacter sp.]